jgi:benzaldehyde dehydrogenase (NAD)
MNNGKTQMKNVLMLIDGEEVSASNGETGATGATFDRRNPLDGEVASRAPAATPEDARAAVRAAQRAFPAWSAMGPGERRRLLSRAADALEAMGDEFAAAMAAETGASACGRRLTCIWPPTGCAKPPR